VVVNNITLYNTLFSTYKTKLYAIVNKHILYEKVEGLSNKALDLSLYYGVIGYICNFEYLYTTTELTIDEIKTKLNYTAIKDCLYCKGYNLDDIIAEIIN